MVGPCSLDISRWQTDVVANAPRVVARGHPRVGLHLEALAVELDPPGRDAGLVIPHQLGGGPVLAAHVRPFLEERRNDRVERPVERQRLAVVGIETESHATLRLQHLVVDRADGRDVGGRGQPTTGAHRELLRSAARRRVAVHHIAVRVLAEPESELQAAVARHRHRAHLLGPRRIARADHREGVRDLVRHLLVGIEQVADRVHAR